MGTTISKENSFCASREKESDKVNIAKPVLVEQHKTFESSIFSPIYPTHGFPCYRRHKDVNGADECGIREAYECSFEAENGKW